MLRRDPCVAADHVKSLSFELSILATNQNAQNVHLKVLALELSAFANNETLQTHISKPASPALLLLSVTSCP